MAIIAETFLVAVIGIRLEIIDEFLKVKYLSGKNWRRSLESLGRLEWKCKLRKNCELKG